MSEKINATCKICGKGYHLCASCKNIMDLNPWRKHTDTSEHYKIYQIIRGYSIKLYNKEEAKQKLQNVDLSDLHELKKNIQEIIKEIMYVEPVEVFMEENNVNEQQEDLLQKMKAPRKKRAVKPTNIEEELSEAN